MIRRSALLALAAGALAFPAAASASTLTASAACYEQGTPLPLSGTGFTPNLRVLFLGGRGDASALPDGNGAFTGEDSSASIPVTNSFTPKSVTITAHDQRAANNDSHVTVQYVRFGSNLPVHGKPGAKVAWQFAGFRPGATIYGHYRYGHNGPFKTLRTVRFGKAAGPCGTLTKKAKRIPIAKPKRGGGWYLQVDTKQKFSSSTEPELDVTFAVH